MRRTWGRAECGSWSDGSRICRRRSRRLKWIRIHTQSPQKTCSPLDASCSCYQYRLHRIYSRYIHRRQDGVQLNAPLSDDTKQGSFISWETKLPYESENKADEWTLQLPFFRRWFALFTQTNLVLGPLSIEKIYGLCQCHHSVIFPTMACSG